MVSDGKHTRQHHHVAFAKTYFRGAFRTFNASAALFRIEQLVAEAEAFAALLRDHQIDHSSITPPHLPGYYIVAFVTCLEWHARSRLADLLAHAPERTTVEDLKAVTEGGKLREMVASRLTVPELVGASANVSNLREYCAVFERIFEAVVPTSLGCTASRAIKARDVEGQKSAWVELEWLYAARHRMVHEITHEQIGHYALRDTVHVEQAVRLGRLVEGCIREVEAVITAHAPDNFPNLLDLNGHPVVEATRLKSDIAATELRLAGLAAKKSDEAIGSGLDPLLVARAVEAARHHIDMELVWLAKFRPAGWRYYNPAYDVEVSLLRNRLEYLLEMEASLSTV